MVLTGAAALGVGMVAPAPLHFAVAADKSYKIGCITPLSGAAAAVGKSGLIGAQMAVNRMNKAGGINKRPVELIAEDDESKPDVGRHKTEKLLVEDEVDAHVGGVLSNICLACMPVFDEHKVLNIIAVCRDTTITTTKCNRYTFRPFDYAPAQAVAFAPYLVNKLGKKWYIVYADYARGAVDARCLCRADQEGGGEVVGGTGIPIGTADMTAFLSKIAGNFDGLFAILFGKDGVTMILGLTKKYKFAGDGAVWESTNLPALGSKIGGFHAINRYIPVLDPPLDTPYHKAFYDDAAGPLKQIDPSGPLPDRYVQSTFEAVSRKRCVSTVGIVG